jgi:hypothetical protein
MSRPDAEYVLPLRWRDDDGLEELTRYLRRLALVLDVTVVDGSPPELFRRHHEAWSGLVRHLGPGPWPGRNGKVRNVMTGIAATRHPLVVIADDDVRYTGSAIERGLRLLDEAALVVPQNVFTDWPWHARWDTGRQLVNRALGSDHPGTLLLRRDALGPEGYDGDVLFENLQLERTVRARGGVVHHAPDLLVPRRPPTTRHFWSQRVRQAYDDLGQPARLVLEVSVLPLVLAAGARRGQVLAALAVASVLVAEAGRRRAGGARAFPPTTALWAPAWLAERSVCVWLALALRLRGGVRYGDGRLLHATSPVPKSSARLVPPPPDARVDGPCVPPDLRHQHDFSDPSTTDPSHPSTTEPPDPRRDHHARPTAAREHHRLP